MYAYVHFLTALFFFIFKEGFNEKIVVKKKYRRLTITVVKEKTLKTTYACRDIQ